MLREKDKKVALSLDKFYANLEMQSYTPLIVKLLTGDEMFFFCPRWRIDVAEVLDPAEYP
jgi:hypothetical protein